MKMQRYKNFWLPLALAILMVSRAACAAAPQITSVGPLEIQSTRVPPPYDAKSAIAAARRYLGESGAAAVVSANGFVQVTDHTRYDGNVGSRTFSAWEITATGVPVSNPGSGTANATVDLTLLLDGNNKNLDAVYTARNDAKWVARDPAYPERTADKAMEEDGWHVDPLTGASSLSSSVPQILSAFWKSSGINPADAGQLFLRPRHLELSLPASRNAKGKLVPLHPSGTYWLMLVSGTKTLDVIAPSTSDAGTMRSGQKGGHYMSGLIAAYSDIGATSVRGIYLP